MASTKWTKPSRATLDYFERLTPGAPLVTRKMFGMPCRFLNGYVLVGVFGNALMLHLSRADRFECIAAGAEPFRPLGRDMKEYVAIAPGTFDDHELKQWIVRGMRYLGSLPPRVEAPPARVAKRKAKGKSKAKRKVKGVKKVVKATVKTKGTRKPAPNGSKERLPARLPKSPAKRHRPKKRPRRR